MNFGNLLLNIHLAANYSSMQNIFFILYTISFVKIVRGFRSFVLSSEMKNIVCVYFCFSALQKQKKCEINIKSQTIEINNMAYVKEELVVSPDTGKEDVPQTGSSENQASPEEAQKLAEQATDPADSNSDGSKKGV